jgi:hypothetical protein
LVEGGFRYSRVGKRLVLEANGIGGRFENGKADEVQIGVKVETIVNFNKMMA